MNKPVRLTLDEIESHAIARLLRSRIPHRRRARIQTPGRTIQILPAMEGHSPYTTNDGRDLVIGLPPEKAEDIAQALGKRGEHRFSWSRSSSSCANDEASTRVVVILRSRRSARRA